jgi:hypothetical protein
MAGKSDCEISVISFWQIRGLIGKSVGAWVDDFAPNMGATLPLGELATAPESRRSTKPEVSSVSCEVCSSLSTSGHNLPVRVTFQFLLVVCPVIKLNGRYSAVKLMNPMPQPGQLRSLVLLLQIGHSLASITRSRSIQPALSSILSRASARIGGTLSPFNSHMKLASLMV